MTRGKGEGAIYKETRGLWAAAIELPSRDGKRRRKIIRSRDKAVVIRSLSNLRSELERTGDLPTASQTLGEWLTYWVDHIAAKRVRPNTLVGYRTLANSIAEAIGKTRLDKLTPAHVRRMHDAITAATSSGNALNAHHVLSRALTDAEREGRVSRNVAKLVDAPRRQRADLDVLTLDEAIRVIAQCVPAFETTPYDPSPALWSTYLLTATRRGEILGLERDRVGDVLDMSWQLQRIPHIETAPADYEYRQLASTLYLTRPKSAAGWRVIPLVEPLKSILANHLERAPENPYGLVFARPDGLPMEPRVVSTDLPKALKAIGITKKVRLHDLRHSTVDLLYEAGVPEDIIIEIVGHSTRSMSRSYKSRGNRQRLTAAMLQLSAYLDSARGPAVEKG